MLGIGLSTLHQSSLGSLFLIMPYRLHPLWYSPILPLLFLVSAIALGMMMVTFESHFTAYLYRRKPETEALASLGGAARWVLLLYLAIRFGDLAVRGQLRHLARGRIGAWRCSGWRSGGHGHRPADPVLDSAGCADRAAANGRRPASASSGWS